MNFTKQVKRTTMAGILTLGIAGLPALAQSSDQDLNTQNQQSSDLSQNQQQNMFSSMHSRSEIRQVQQQLKNDGFYNGKIDGIQGPKTRAAIRQYQQQNNLAVTGRLDQQTAQALGVSATSGMQGEAARSATGFGNQIEQAQTQLKDKGFYKGTVDGISGPQTHHAIREFQRKNNLRVTGRLDQQTLQALGVSGQGTASRSMEEQNQQPQQVTPSQPGQSPDQYQQQTTPNQSGQSPDQYQQQTTPNQPGEMTQPGQAPPPDQSNQSVTPDQNQSATPQDEAYTPQSDQSNNQADQASRSQSEQGTENQQSATQQTNLSGTTIRAAQQALKDKGFYSGPVDGVMNPQTRTAITNFQQQNNLPANGFLTEKTAKSLGIAGNEQGQQQFENPGSGQ